MVLRAVLMKSGLVSINTARQNISKIAVLVNTARQVNTAHSKTTVNVARPMSYLSKTAHSTMEDMLLLEGTPKDGKSQEKEQGIVEKYLHIKFSRSTPNVVVRGPDWLFDIDALTRIMNYELIVAGTHSHDDGSKPSSDDGKQVDEDLRKESECNDQENEDNVNNTNNVNAADINEVDVVGGKTSIEPLFDPNMPVLKDYSIFDFSRDNEDDGVEANMNNLDTTIQVSPIPTTIIHKDHPLEQVIGDLE
ncbi:hypothetical protein Tco_0486871 [Tanacetum coccineum]